MYANSEQFIRLYQAEEIRRRRDLERARIARERAEGYRLEGVTSFHDGLSTPAS